MKKRFSARKEPQQVRGHETVQKILDAATYILIKEGWQGLTTNRIAKRARINIASLYQYFPNKEAIAREIQRRHGERIRGKLKETIFAPQKTRSLHEILQDTIVATVEEHRPSPQLHRVMSEELPRSLRQQSSRSRILEIADAWRGMVAPKFTGVPDPEIAVFISRVVFEAVIREAAIERPELLSNPLLIDELVALLEGYLDRSHNGMRKVEGKAK